MVLELADFLGLSCEEIAEVAECPLGTVKTRMFYGRERLRQVLVTLAVPEKTAAQIAKTAAALTSPGMDDHV